MINPADLHKVCNDILKCAETGGPVKDVIEASVYSEAELVHELALSYVRNQLLNQFATAVLETFEKSEAQGYRSRDRQFAIDLLGKALR
ncbi:hypothetical protein [Bradyrhizobium sp. HKCCYLS20291]|uniref:hypothetical protein n=1 Tax=Bradyrhizobium sp. HKCCYLS20291 TaxID=3420766 RepID=UPI003EBC08CF